MYAYTSWNSFLTIRLRNFISKRTNNQELIRRNSQSIYYELSWAASFSQVLENININSNFLHSNLFNSLTNIIITRFTTKIDNIFAIKSKDNFLHENWLAIWKSRNVLNFSSIF